MACLLRIAISKGSIINAKSKGESESINETQNYFSESSRELNLQLLEPNILSWNWRESESGAWSDIRMLPYEQALTLNNNLLSKKSNQYESNYGGHERKELYCCAVVNEKTYIGLTARS